MIQTTCTIGYKHCNKAVILTLTEFTKLKTSLNSSSETCKIDLKAAFESIQIEGMLYFMVFMWVLCVGEIVHCENDFEPDYIGYNAGLAKNKLNFSYGVNFKFNGKVHNNLDRVWVVKRFNLPQELNLPFKGLNFVLNCTYDNLTKSVKHD